MSLCLREDLKGNSGRLKNFCLLVSPLYFLFFSFFLNGSRRTVMCSLYIYTSQYLKEKVYNIFSEDRHRKQTITFFAANSYNPIFHYKCKLIIQQLTSFFSLKKRPTRARKADEPVRFRIELELFHLLDKLTLIFQWEYKALNNKLKTNAVN